MTGRLPQEGDGGAGLHGAVEARAAANPDAVAVVDPSGSWTYGALDRRAEAVAERLADLGVPPGAPVGVHLPHANVLAAGLLGVLKAGAACLPLDPLLPEQRLRWMVEDSGAEVVLSSGSGGPTGLARTSVDVGEVLAAPSGRAVPSRRAVDPASPAYVIYTSGSTGTPKGVVVPHRGLRNHQQAAVDLYGLTSGDAVLQLSSIGFDISIEEMFPTWAAGGRVVFRAADAPLSGAAFVDDLTRLGVTVLDLPTAFWHEWVRDLAAVDRRVPPTLRAVIVGGERAQPAVFAQWRRLGGEAVRWFNTYGPTEASVIATAWEAPLGPTGELRDLPIGSPIAGVSLQVVDETGRPVPDGAPGELMIGGSGVALGYLNRPELTDERFVADPSGADGARCYRTGDRVIRDATQLRFLGRTDDQVKIRGFRVEPGEVEAALMADPRIDQAVVTARGGADGSARLVAYVVPAHGAPVDPAEVLRLLPERLPLHMVPASMVVLDRLPLTPNGKVDKAALPEAARATRMSAAPPEPERDALDRALVDLWKEVLELDEVGIDDDFFELGGHSLAAVRLLGMIEWLMGVAVPLGILLEGPTVRHVGDVIRAGALPAGEGVLQTVRAAGGKPPLLYVCTVETGVVALRHVLPYLDPGRPVHAFVLRRTKDHDNVRSIEDLARIGMEELTATCGAGPCSVLGYSFGGLVAYEMACSMREAGRSVELLGLLDTWHPRSAPARDRYRRQWRDARSAWSGSSRTGLRSLASVALGIGRDLVAGERPAQPIAEPGLPNLAAGDLLLDDGSLSAMYDAYAPRPYPGRVVLLTTETTVARRGDPWLGWGPVRTGAWSLDQVQGEHGSVMQPGNAPVVGRVLARSLDPAARSALAGAGAHR